jgi:hypothetical protein
MKWCNSGYRRMNFTFGARNIRNHESYWEVIRSDEEYLFVLENSWQWAKLRFQEREEPIMVSLSLSLEPSGYFFFNSHSGGWSPSWVHSARRPFTDLLYLPRVIMMMENLVEWSLAGETEVPRGNLPQRHFVHHKSNLTRPGLEPGPPRWEASD